MHINQVWTEKYRPQNIEDVILNEDEKNFFLNLQEIPNNLLLLGSPGIGKSTVAKILAKKFAPNSYMYINASEQGNIETIRSLVSDFISVASIDGNQKIVILDEADGVSLVAQQALRSIMEEYLDSVKFILTANYRNKIIEALHSRCQEFNFSCSEKMVLKTVAQILKKENITVNKESLDDLRLLVKTFFPDIRKTLNELQKACQTGVFLYQKKDTGDFAREIKENLKEGKDVFFIRQMVVERTEKFGNDYHRLMRDMFKLYVKECNTVACLLISEYMYRHSFVLDHEVNFTALLLSLKTKL